jgi:hypothetical protein
MVGDAGGEVVAETEVAFEAMDVAQRFGCDVLVLDTLVSLSLGRHPLADLDRSDRSYHVVLLTDLVGEFDVDHPNSTLIERHDRLALAKVFDRFTDDRGTERRRVPGSLVSAPNTNLRTAETFHTSLNQAEPGDVLLIVGTGDPSDVAALAHACSREVRVTDHVLILSAEVAIFMPGGDNVGEGAAWARIRERWRGERPLRAARAVLESEPPSTVYVDTLRELRAQLA